MNWACPVDGSAEVWENPVAALSHVWSTDGRGHGPEESLGDPPQFPDPTDDPATMQTLDQVVEPQTQTELDVLMSELENQGFEFASRLDQEDLETFSLVRRHRGISHDLEVMRSQLSDIDRVFSRLLREWDHITGDTVIEETVEAPEPQITPDDSTDQTPDQSGRFTTDEVREREQEQVFSVIERSKLFDNKTDDLYETFKFVYRQRTENGVYQDEVVSEVGMPPNLVEDNLDELNDMGMIEHDPSDDRFYVPY